MSNRFGRVHADLPYCLQQLPENQPRNYHEYMIRRRMIPGDTEMYFDKRKRFLYDSKPVAQEIEELKNSKKASLEFVQRQTECIKSLLFGDEPKPEVDIDRMRKRLRQAHIQHAEAVDKHNALSSSYSTNSVTSHARKMKSAGVLGGV